MSCRRGAGMLLSSHAVEMRSRSSRLSTETNNGDNDRMQEGAGKEKRTGGKKEGREEETREFPRSWRPRAPRTQVRPRQSRRASAKPLGGGLGGSGRARQMNFLTRAFRHAGELPPSCGAHLAQAAPRNPGRSSRGHMPFKLSSTTAGHRHPLLSFFSFPPSGDFFPHDRCAHSNWIQSGCADRVSSAGMTIAAACGNALAALRGLGHPCPVPPCRRHVGMGPRAMGLAAGGGPVVGVRG